MKIHLDMLPPRPPRGELIGLDTELYNMDQRRLHRPHGDLACLSVAVGDDVYVVTTPRDLAAALKRVDRCEWVMQKGEFDVRQWRRWTLVPPRRYWDTFYVEKALYSNYYDRFGLDSLSRRWLQTPMDKEAREHFYQTSVRGRAGQSSMDFPPKLTAEMIRYAARDAWTALRAAEAQMALCSGPEDPDGGTSAATMIENVWYDTDLPALWAILDMSGVCVDAAAWGRIADEQQAILDKSRSKLDYNPASNENVAKRLRAEGIKLPKTDAGNWSVREEAIAEHAGKSETVRQVLEFRSAQKFAGTYGRKFLNFIEEDGRIHAEFNLYRAETGRLSSESPNLQNIPVRDNVYGPRYRRAFVPAKGNMYVKADYTQCQIAGLAQAAYDEPLIETFRKRLDVHTANAAWLYGVPIGEVTKEQRNHAKGVTFGVMFGEGAGPLAEKEGITKKEAQIFIDRFFQTHPGVDAWTRGQLASKADFVESLIGRRAWINPYGGKHSQNNRLNSPIQMVEVDIHKRAMAKVHQRWPQEWGQFGLVLPVHDEMVFEVSRAHAQSCKRLVRECALEAEAEMLPDVRPAAEVSVCHNWYGDKL